jgi:hypothetical protein
MRQFKLFLAMMLVSLGTIVAVPAPAMASCTSILGTLYCGKVYHHAPDDGYDAPIIVTCDWGTKVPKWVYEGNWDPCRDMDGMYARPGEDIVCYRADIGVWQLLVEDGWFKTNDLYNGRCVVQVG